MTMALLKLVESESSLYEEITLSPSVLGKRVDFLYSFLSSLGFSSLSEISVNTLKAFITTVRHEFAFSPKQYSAYKGDLETVYFAYMKENGHPLTVSSFAETARGRKCLTFLMVSGIESFSEITADTRALYDDYLALSVPAKHSEYLKALDQMVLSEIKKITIRRTPPYENRLLFLGYFPDPYIAERLYYTARKEFLYFDFSLPASVTVKKQIYKVLLFDLSQIKDRKNHYMIQHFITPLYYLYKYCVSAGIQDLKHITDKEVSDFHAFLEKNMDAISKNAPQVLYRARRFLFLSDSKPDFTATLWFLERFSLSERANPTRGIECFNFGDVSYEHREILQHYMKYLLVLSPKYSMQSLLEKYYGAKEFTKYLEEKHSSLSELSYSDIEGFIEYKDSQDLRPETYNRTLTMLSFFLTTLSVREKLLIPSFPFDYFYKKARYLHHDRTVEEETIDQIFTVLSDFPETLGLMYLTLYSTGLRINEVCSLRKDALFSDNGAFWLKIYQYKLRSDKQIPIPEEVSRLLRRHIKEDDSGSEFIFPSCKDKNKPYQAATFVKQMKSQLLLYEETKDIDFKSHDYRHTIATDLHMSGAPLGTTRAYLGHTRDDMTKQYIDHLPGRIDLLQEEYFKENHIE